MQCNKYFQIRKYDFQYLRTNLPSLNQREESVSRLLLSAMCADKKVGKMDISD